MPEGTKNFRIESIGEGSIAILLRHREAMWREIGNYTEEQINKSQTNYERWLLKRLISGEVVAFAAVDGTGNILGSGSLWFQDSRPTPHNPEGTIAYLMSMYVEPQNRRNGVASALLGEAIEFTRKSGCRRMVLHASRFGRGLYERAGFIETNEMKLDI